MDYYIADTHFDDENILIYSRPQFKSVKEMNELIIKNWIDTVKSDEDTVWHLGDVGNCEYLKDLPGKKIIILGNHDNEEEIRKTLPGAKIYDMPIIDRFLFLSHKPIEFLPKEIPYLNIHGHLHQYDYRMTDGLNWYKGNRYFNASCEKIGFKPISALDIMKKIGYKKT